METVIKGTNGHAGVNPLKAPARRLRGGTQPAKAEQKGLPHPRYFTKPEVHPFDELEWEYREANITNEKGEVVFSQKNVEIPKTWSQLATNVVVSKYFRGPLGTPERETSVKRLVSRVSGTIAGWARQSQYFASENDAQAFEDELTHLLVTQKMAFNSPVWFNVGIDKHPQCSACFINSVQDDMRSILELAKTEGMLFKGGSGTGTNLSTLRSSREQLSSGGSASGPVSFMKGYDAFAGVIKSGGKTRRAAKMVILNIDHPDVETFIKCKELEEKKAWALIDAGYDSSFNGEAYGSIFFQNSNNSVRVNDEYMHAVENDGDWTTRAIKDHRPIDTYKARDLMKMIADSAWVCGDPGLQFDTTINDWHTCPNSDRIHASNPCSEYMFLNDTACNLASLNLMKFVSDGRFDVQSYRAALRTTILAQEIIVDNASYPTPAIEKNSHDYRPLGIGYANLGALLMSLGLPYDSEAGRAYAAALTAVLSGHTYRASAEVARDRGPFAGYAKNREPMLRVIRKHADAVKEIDRAYVPDDLYRAAEEDWEEAYELGKLYGFKNSQISVLAPTGTIGFMMDCDTTGVEPDIALVKYKKLVGGGFLKIVNQTVPMALKKLGYEETDRKAILKYIDEKETIEGAPGLEAGHLPVFDCAFKPLNGVRFIHYMGHLRMMSAVQPFISGAISKTVNVPNEITPEEISKTYMEAWKLGIKAIAVYRDGCKRSQPLNTSKDEDKKAAKAPNELPREARRRLPDERRSITHKFSVAGHEGYITVGMYEDGTPGEIFLVMSKEGSVVSGLMDSFATAISMALQYGVPMKVLVDKFSHTRFEPSGMTGNPSIPFAKSVVDYVIRWLASKFLNGTEQKEAGVLQRETETSEAKVPSVAAVAAASTRSSAFTMQADAPPCPDCGSIMVRNGVCYKCLDCGTTSGCS
jgi:ribonucleoside-diphosphate reductase alpha chain